MRCDNCERCTWDPGDDCGIQEHGHCEKCGHCVGRHRSDTAWVPGSWVFEDGEWYRSWVEVPSLA